MDEDKELRSKVYALVLLLVKKYHVLYHMRFTVYAHENDFIKMWERGNKDGKYICNIQEKGEGKTERCLKKALYELTYYQKQREKTENADLAV